MKKTIQDFNIHTHTTRCKHAEGTDEQYVKAAIEAGYKVLGFSDHIPFDADGMEYRMEYGELNEYIESINALKEKYKDKIQIKIGFEVEYFEEYHNYYVELRQKCDYLLLGQHMSDLYTGYDYYCGDEEVIQYANDVKKALDTKLFIALAHPDYFMLGRRSFNDACKECAKIIAKSALENDIPLEINLNGVTKGPYNYDGKWQNPYPFREFWEIMVEEKVKMIYGVDAHRPVAFLDTYRYDKCNEILKDLSLNLINKINF